MGLLLFSFLLCLASFFQCSRAGDDLLVNTSLGQVLGHFNEAGMKEWKGIRYSRPMSGDMRWQYSSFPESSNEVFEANFDAPGCQQICNLPPGNCPVYGQSEDCLFLTVMSPSEPSSDPNGYPVFFWIHGGAYTQGIGNCALYDGTTFAQNNVITVVINYRLGALGFLASESMTGNYGLLDQRLAMQWTQDNIAGFGGNPDKVTIAGQSAGAMSVSCHISSPNSRGLFIQGIMESNPYGLPYHTRESAASNAKQVFTYLNCAVDDVACMKTKTVDEVLDAQNHAIKLDPNTLFINFVPFAPLVEKDGELPEQPLYAMANGDFQTLPLLSGTNGDEGQLFVYELFTKSIPKNAYTVLINTIFGTAYAKDILSYYPFDIVEGNTDGRNSLNILATDLLFYCPLRNVTRGFQSQMGSAAKPNYIYKFQHLLSFDCWGPDYQFCVGSVCHGSELPFVFNVFTDGGENTYDPTTDEKQLAVDLTNAWSNFVTTSNPNNFSPVPAAFPAYSTADDTLVFINEPGSNDASNFRSSYCDLWDRIGFFW